VNREDIIRMARNSGFEIDCCSLEWHDRIERFAALVAANEREQCAKIADNNRHNLEMLTSLPLQSGAARCIASGIRARGEK
jgi:hypothetical protein